LATALGGAFIDGDQHGADGPWFASSLSASRLIVRTGLSALDRQPVVVIGYPVRRSGWIFFRRKFAEASVRTLFVGLGATYEEIVAAPRNRSFSPAEHARIKIMIEQGYGRQAFNDVLIDAGGLAFREVVRRLVNVVVPLIAS
jgi:hypothetical protein